MEQPFNNYSGNKIENLNRSLIQNGKTYTLPGKIGDSIFTTKWTYKNPDGSRLFERARYENGTNKTIRPFYIDPSGILVMKEPPGRLLPPLKADMLLKNPDAPVLVLEGEKAATCQTAKNLEDISYIVVTLPKNVNKCDLSLLKHRNFICYMPDKDLVGYKKALEFLKAIPKTIIVPPFPEWPKGADIADYDIDGMELNNYIETTNLSIGELKELAEITPDEEVAEENRLKLTNKKFRKEKKEINCSSHPDEIISQMVEIIKEQYTTDSTDPMAFIRGGVIVKIVLVDSKAMIDLFSETQLRERLQHLCNFYYQLKNDKIKQTLCPLDYAKMIFAMKNPPFPLLKGIKSHPYFWGDELITKEGYNSETGLYLKYPHKRDLINIPLDESKEIINDLFCDFPFASRADRANIIGAFLWTLMSERETGNTLNNLIEAASPGTGKTLILFCGLFPILGEEPVITPEIKDTNEFSKHLISWLMEGKEIIILDNVNETLDSGVLAAALTAPVISGRILGKSKTTTITNNIHFFETANNPILSQEIARRSGISRQVANTSKPWERDPSEFKHPDIRKYVRDNQDLILSAYISICQSWIDAGAKSWTGRPLGSFETYCRVVGGILEHAGIEGFLENRFSVFEEADTESLAFGEFLGAWWERFSNSPVPVASLYPVAQTVDALDLGDGSMRGQKINLGRMLSKRRDSILDDLRIRSAGKKSRIAQWKLEKVNTGQSESNNSHVKNEITETEELGIF